MVNTGALSKERVADTSEPLPPTGHRHLYHLVCAPWYAISASMGADDTSIFRRECIRYCIWYDAMVSQWSRWKVRQRWARTIWLSCWCCVASGCGRVGHCWRRFVVDYQALLPSVHEMPVPILWWIVYTYRPCNTSSTAVGDTNVSLLIGVGSYWWECGQVVVVPSDCT